MGEARPCVTPHPGPPPPAFAKASAGKQGGGRVRYRRLRRGAGGRGLGRAAGEALQEAPSAENALGEQLADQAGTLVAGVKLRLVSRNRAPFDAEGARGLGEDGLRPHGKLLQVQARVLRRISLGMSL